MPQKLRRLFDHFKRESDKGKTPEPVEDVVMRGARKRVVVLLCSRTTNLGIGE